jgi:hypothetical protein
MKTLLAVAACAFLIPVGVALAQSSPNSPDTGVSQCQPGQVLNSNGQSCLPAVVKPPPVQSTGSLGQFPTDLLQPTPLAPTQGGSSNCQAGQILQSNGQAC